MTAIIGILNKQGVAIAADSAVTRNRGRKGTKYTKNGNKMIRLSNAVPISVMTAGNAEYLRTPWDLVVRQYRGARGDVRHKSVEDAVQDFFRFISETPVFWEDNAAPQRWVGHQMDALFNEVREGLGDELEKKDDGSLRRPGAFRRRFAALLHDRDRRSLREGLCPQFVDYPQDRFDECVGAQVDAYFDSLSDDDPDFEFPWHEDNTIPSGALDPVKQDFLRSLRIRISSHLADDDASAQLIFTGFGADEVYPTMITVYVCEGFDRRVNYYYEPRDVVRISDRNPVAIRAFAQTDVVDAVLTGCHDEWFDDVMGGANAAFNDTPVLSDEENERDFLDIVMDVNICGPRLAPIRREMMDSFRRERHAWERALKDSDVRALADMAELMIALTGFHRIISFEQEGVGGPVDVAVVTRNDGFTWLNRKSWYHRKDVGGRYGSLGV